MFEHLRQLDDFTLIVLGVAFAAALIVILRWMGSREVAPQARLMIAGDGSFDYGIAGTEAHQPFLSRLAGRAASRQGEEYVVELVPALAPTGEVSEIVVHLEGAGVGAIHLRDLPAFHATMKGRATRCDALVIRDREGRLTIMLDVLWPPRVG